MNSNATVRDAGSQRAAELSAVYPQVRFFSLRSLVPFVSVVFG